MFFYFYQKNKAEISAYTYEKTLKLHERQKLIREMKLKNRNIENEVKQFFFTNLEDSFFFK